MTAVRPIARARRRQLPGVMNRTEQRYAQALESRRAVGIIDAWLFEAIKLRLGDKCFYTPDFLVITSSGEVELHEVKGHWEDDARVKIKVAAARFPWFRFVAVRPQARNRALEQWSFEEIRSHHSEAS